MFSMDDYDDGGGFMLVFGVLFAFLGVAFVLALAAHAVIGESADTPSPPQKVCITVNGDLYCKP